MECVLRRRPSSQSRRLSAAAPTRQLLGLCSLSIYLPFPQSNQGYTPANTELVSAKPLADAACYVLRIKGALLSNILGRQNR